MANHKNYRNQYNKNKNTVKPIEKNEPVKEVADTVVDAEEPTTIVPAPIKHGVVVNCDRLNVRMYPRTESKVLCIINRDDEVEVHDSIDPVNFYKIMTTDGIIGFCVKEFISLRE